MILEIEIEHEDGDRWIADIPQMPGVTVYGITARHAVNNVKVLALRVLASGIERESASGSTLQEIRFVIAIPR